MRRQCGDLVERLAVTIGADRRPAEMFMVEAGIGIGRAGPVGNPTFPRLKSDVSDFDKPYAELDISSSVAGERRVKFQAADHTIRFSISPIFSIHSLTVSPALRNSPRPAPTPAGVPVRIMSPG